VQISLIMSHPSGASLCAALAGATREALLAAGHEVRFHHLDLEGFDPRLGAVELAGRSSDDSLVERHCRELAACEGLVIVHPNWWSQPPATLKGWLDRVVRPGVAYEFRKDDAGRSLPVGLLRARAALVLNTANVPQAQEQALLGDPLETLWCKSVLPRCGITRARREVFAVVASSTPADRAAWLERAAALAREIFVR
jgi:putative NADPH-quinone reductase